MKKLLWACAAIMLLLAGKPSAQDAAVQEDLLKFGPFGNVLVYKSQPTPQQVMIFISGDGGFDKPFIDMVHTAARKDTMVIAVDINTYLKNMAKQKSVCMYAAADLEGLSQFVQTHYHYAQYVSPMLAGYSSGATMAYTSLVQGPPNTFAGAISLGFCSDMTSPKPFCKGAGLTNKEGGEKEPTAPKSYKNYIYGDVSATVAPWISLQGGKDKLCPADKAGLFMANVKNASMVSLSTVDHGFLVGEKWQDAFDASVDKIIAQQHKADAAKVKPQSLKDLPIVESGLASPRGKPLAIIVTGDGGWAGIDRDIGGALNAQGVNVVGLNSLQYFWTPKTPDIAGRDLSRILASYDEAWSPSYVMLIGYSLGADTLSFMINRLPEAQKANVKVIALLGAEREASFSFKVSDWLMSGSHGDELPIKPEAEKLPAVAKLCFYGADETADSLCPTLTPGTFTIIKTEGGHHFGGDYKKLAAQILAHSK